MILSEYCRETEDVECVQNIENHRTSTKTQFYYESGNYCVHL